MTFKEQFTFGNWSRGTFTYVAISLLVYIFYEFIPNIVGESLRTIIVILVIIFLPFFINSLIKEYFGDEW